MRQDIDARGYEVRQGRYADTKSDKIGPRKGKGAMNKHCITLIDVHGSLCRRMFMTTLKESLSTRET